MTNNNEREKIAAKIRALLNVTIENGATENEAIMAATKADQLMLEYNLSSLDLVEPKERYGKRGQPFCGGSNRRITYHAVDNCVKAIAEFTDCKVWYMGYDLVYFGTDIDTAFAHYLTDMIKSAMETEYRKAERSLKAEATAQGYRVHGKTLRTSFMLGMAIRINARLREMKQARDVNINNASVAKTGTELVVVRNAILEQKYKQLGLNLNSRSKSSKNVHGSSYNAGKTAGNSVNLSRPLGSGATAQIGSV